MGTALKQTGTRIPHKRMYVEQGAASAFADGSGNRPFASLAAALAKCPLPAGQDLSDLRTLTCNGVLKNIVIDRPSIIEGPAFIDEIEVVTGPVILTGIFCNVLKIKDSSMCLIMNMSATEIEAEDSNVVINSLRGEKLTCVGEGSADIHSAVIAGQSVTIPVGWTVVIYNSVVENVTGDYTAYNSEEI